MPAAAPGDKLDFPLDCAVEVVVPGDVVVSEDVAVLEDVEEADWYVDVSLALSLASSGSSE